MSDFPGELVGIWLEHVLSTEPVPWSLTTFARVAEHLGNFTRFTSELLISAARTAPARNLCGRPDLCEYSLALLDEYSSHPWESRAPLLSALASVPLVVCHGHAQCNNLFPQSSRVTVAVDWANLATGPVGLDAAALWHYALAYFHHDVDQANDLDRRIFDGYMRGSAIDNEAALVQAGLAYVAQLAFGVGLLEVGPVLRLVREPDRREAAEAFYRHSLHDILDRRSHLAEFLLGLGREARALAAECA